MTNEASIRLFSRGSRLTAYLFLTVVCVGISCESSRQMAPLPPHFSVFSPDQVPVILVGQVLENSQAAGPARTSEWDGRPVQLWKVRVRVEQILQGEVQPKQVDIFYFADMGPGSFSVAPVWRDLYAGHSEVFFLQRDAGRLRTICDGWRSCIMWVRTGSHYNFKREPSLTIEDVIVRLLLSRGDHTTDKQMIDAIYHPELRWGTLPVFNALKRLVAEEKSAAVRAVALEEVRNFQIHYGSPTRQPHQNL